MTIHTPHPWLVLDEIEAEHRARRRHPAGRARDPLTTACEFHDEVDAQTGRVLPRTIPARTDCAPASAPRPIADHEPLRLGEAAGITAVALTAVLGVLLALRPIWAVVA